MVSKFYNIVELRILWNKPVVVGPVALNPLTHRPTEKITCAAATATTQADNRVVPLIQALLLLLLRAVAFLQVNHLLESNGLIQDPVLYSKTHMTHTQQKLEYYFSILAMKHFCLFVSQFPIFKIFTPAILSGFGLNWHRWMHQEGQVDTKVIWRFAKTFCSNSTSTISFKFILSFIWNR